MAADGIETEAQLRDALHDAYHEFRYHEEIRGFYPAEDERDIDDRYANIALEVFRPLLNRVLEVESASDSPPPVTEETLDGLGFKLIATFDQLEKDRVVSLVALEEEKERIGKQVGEENMISSFFYDGNALVLGLFVNKDSYPVPKPQALTL